MTKLCMLFNHFRSLLRPHCLDYNLPETIKSLRLQRLQIGGQKVEFLGGLQLAMLSGLTIKFGDIG